MNTPLRCDVRAPGEHRRRSTRGACGRVVLGVLLAAVPIGATGCGYSGGQLLYFLGFGRAKQVKARFTLTNEPILILIDDVGGVIDHPPARRQLADALAQALLRHNAAARIVPQATVDRLRQAEPEFDRMSIRRIGEIAHARQVLHVSVRDYVATERFEDLSAAAQMAVTVKVIDVRKTGDRSNVRLWPAGAAGHLVTASLDAEEVARAKTRAWVSKELTDKLARRVARLFYTHRLDDFGHDE